MGMIDRSIEKLTHEKQCFIDEGWDDTGEIEAYDTAISIMRKYQNMETMLTELKSEMNPIKECEQQIYGKECWNFVRKCQDVIQQKIDALKGEENGIHEN